MPLVRVSNGGTSLELKQTSTLKSSGTYATSISQSLTTNQKYTNGLLVISFGGVNVGNGTPAVNISGAAFITTIGTNSQGATHIYSFSCPANTTITVTVSHSSTGGGTSLLIFGLLG